MAFVRASIITGLTERSPSASCSSLRLALILLAGRLTLKVKQRTLQVREIARVEHLNARVVLAVEGRDRAWAAGFDRILRIVEPQAQMVLDREGGRVLADIRECVVKHLFGSPICGLIVLLVRARSAGAMGPLENT